MSDKSIIQTNLTKGDSKDILSPDYYSILKNWYLEDKIKYIK